MVRRALEDQGARVPVGAMPGYALAITARGRSAMIATVYADTGAPVVTLGVARDSKAGAGLWPVICRDTQALDLRRPSAPWLAVRLEEGVTSIPPLDVLALGDLERCLAWTWLETT